MSNKKVVLITGNAGFIGSHIAEEFIKHNYLVLGIDNLKNGKKANIHPHVKFFNLDLNKIQAVEDIIKKYKPYFLIHNASNLVDVMQSIKYPNRSYKDVQMTVNIVEKAQKYGIGQIIFPSSANVYGNQFKQPLTEEYLVQPLSPYGLAKAAIEEFLQYYSLAYKIRVCIFRYFNVYGPRQSIHYSPVIPNFISSLLANKKIHINGGNQTRDFVFVKDVAHANRIACEKNAEGIFNVGSGKQTQIKQVLTLLEKLTQRHTQIKQYPKDSTDSDFSQASIKKIQHKLEWKPHVNFEDGLKQTIAFYSQDSNSKTRNKNSAKQYFQSPSV